MTDLAALEIAGPFATTRDAEITAYVVRGPFQEVTYTVCIVTPNKPELLIIVSKNFQIIFESVLESSSQNLVGWRDIPCYTFILQSDDKPSSDHSNIAHIKAVTDTFDTKETDLDKIAEAV